MRGNVLTESVEFKNTEHLNLLIWSLHYYLCLPFGLWSLKLNSGKNICKNKESSLQRHCHLTTHFWDLHKIRNMYKVKWNMIQKYSCIWKYVIHLFCCFLLQISHILHSSKHKYQVEMCLLNDCFLTGTLVRLYCTVATTAHRMNAPTFSMQSSNKSNKSDIWLHSRQLST